MVSVASTVWKQWGSWNSGDSIALLVKTGEGGALALAQQACAQVMDSFDAAGAGAYLAVQPTMKGPGVYIGDCDDLQFVLDRLIPALEAVGLGDCALTLLPSVTLPNRGTITGATRTRFVRARMAIAATVRPLAPDRDPRSIAHPGWDVDPADARATVDYAVDFCQRLPDRGSTSFVYTTGRWTEVPDSAVRELLHHLVGHGGLDMPPYLQVHGPDGIYRSADLSLGHAHLALASGVDNEHRYSWPDNLEQMTNVLIESPPCVVSGDLCRGDGDAGLDASLLRPDAPHATVPNVGYEPWTNRGYEQNWVTDAYGVVLLRQPGIQERVTTSPEWTVQSAGSDGLLLRWNDPAAWFADHAPSTDFLTHARAAMKPLLPPSSDDQQRPLT